MSVPATKKSFSRLEMEIYKLKAKGYLKHASLSYDQITVQMRGPKDTPYSNGIFLLNINVPDNYPFKSPSIGFISKVFHPNVDEASGTICLDVLNQVWTPLYDLVTVVEVFIPQLLSYPNPTDPLNTNAAQMYLENRQNFNKIAGEYIKKHCTVVDPEREDDSLSLSDNEFDFEAELV